MRLRWVRVRNFRGVEDNRVDLSDAVTIVEGPNEVGKSSIAEAVRVLRRYKSSSQHSDIQALQPVGRDVGPEAWVDLTTGPYELTYHKRWLRQPLTELTVRTPLPEQVTGAQAHERFLRILDETVDVELLDALDARQGRSLDQPELAGLSALHRALDEQEGALQEHDALMDRIEQEYLRHFTPNGRPTGDYRRAQIELSDLRDTVEALRSESDEMDRLTERHAHARALRDELSAHATGAEAELRDLETRAERVSALREADDRARHALAEAVRARAEVAEAQEARSKLIRELESRRKAATEWADQLDQSGRDLAPAEAALVADQGAAERAEESRRAAREAARRWADRARRSRDARTVEELRRRLAAARRADEQRRTAAAQLEANRIDPACLARLQAAETAVRLAEAARASAAPVAEITPEPGAEVSVGERSVTEFLRCPIVDEVVVAVPGAVRIVVRPGRGPEQLDADVASARDALSAALDAAGATDLGHARHLAAAWDRARRSLDQAEAALESLLPDGDLEALADRVASLENALDPGGDDAPDDPASAAPGDDADLDRRAEAARADEERAEAAADAAGLELARCRQARDAAREHLTQTQVRWESAVEERDRLDGELAAARTGTTDEQLAVSSAAAEEALADCRRAAEAARAALDAEDPDMLDLLLGNARDVVARHRGELLQVRDDLAHIEGALHEHESKGIWSRYQEAQAALDAAESRFEHLDRRAAAVSLLRETMLRRRDEARRRYVSPFTDRIDRLGRIVFGREFRSQVSTDLRLESRTLDGDTVSFSSLSAGAREQLALIGRLACAQLVAPDEGAPLILDDTLGFTDPDRLRSLNMLLHEAGGSVQILVLTCQPERFAHVGGATVVRLRPRAS